MPFIRITYPKIQAFDNNGDFAVNYEIWTYDAGGSTPATTYSDEALSVANANPVILNARGEADIYTAIALKLVFTVPGGDPTNPIWSVDYVTTQQTQYIITASATAGTTNNNYVCAVTPPFTAPLPNNLTLVMTPDKDSLATLGTETFTGTGINDLVWSGPFVGTMAGMVFTVQIDGSNYQGSTLNDLTWGGTPVAGHVYTVEIDSVNTPDTFKWRKDGGAWTTGVAITGSAQTLTDGVTVTFANTGAATAPTAPTLAAGAAGLVTNGTHYVAITYVTEFGETIVGTPSSVITIGSDDKISVSAIPTSASGIVTGRNVYMTKAGAANTGPYYLVSNGGPTIADNTTTTYTINVADATLGTGNYVASPSANTTGHTLGDIWNNINTFEWKNNGSFTTGVPITASKQGLIQGVNVTFATITGHTLGDNWTVQVMTPARLNFCSLGNILIYKNVAGTLVALDAGDMKANYPATLVYSLSQNVWLLMNPSLPVLSTTPGGGGTPAQPKRYRKIIMGAYKVVTGDQGNEIACINAPYTVSLDLAANLSQQFFYIKRVGPTGQAITIAVTGTAPLELIYPPGASVGATTFTLDDTLDSVQLQCNGVDFHILAVSEPRKTVPTVYFTPGTFTYTTAAWQTSVTLTGSAAGGAGGGTTGGANAAGSGGLAGQWAYKQAVTVVPGTIYTVTIPGAATGTGGNLVFGALVLTGGAKGGDNDGSSAFALTNDAVSVGAPGQGGPFGEGGPPVTVAAPSGSALQAAGLDGRGYGAGGGGAAAVKATSGSNLGGKGAQGFLVVE